MKKQITVDFGNIIQELENKKIKLCLIKNKSWFIIDEQENLYWIETYWHGSYLDRLIKEGITVKFNLINAKYINEWEKEIWDISEIEEFIKRQSL
jgi:hypothetical protein